MNEQFRTMHLFAGGGGGLLADLILGHQPICAVEWDKYACSILRERVADGWFPDMHVYEGDVRLFNPSEYAGRVDCIHAGFPCQDISVAGKQAGVGADTRSGLYREVLRIADLVRPRELFLENVSAILSNGLGIVLGDLSARGYSARWICVRASDVGANHQRDRWWLLARKTMDNAISQRWSKGRNDNGQDDRNISTSTSKYSFEVANPNGQDWGASSMGQDTRSDGRDEFSGCGKDVPDTDGLQRKGEWSSITDTAEHSATWRPCCLCGYEFDQELLGRYGCPNCEGDGETKSSLCGMDDGMAFELDAGWWEVEPDVGRVTNISKDRAAQLKALGNGQVPLQAAVAYSMLKELF